jgi:hypothetical protein
VLPAGKRIDLQSFAGRVLEGAEVFPAAVREILLGAVEPPALQRLALHQGLDAVDSGPLLEPGHQVLLTTVAEDVLQSLGLGPVLGADQDRLVPSSEDLLPPAGEPADLPGELGVEMVHETRELLGVIHLEG